jgi:hypothetical protein
VSNGHGVAPELLRYVDDYVDETNLDDALRSHLDRNSNLIVFCRELFAQLFANVVGEAITSIGAASAQRANVLRRTHKSRWPASLNRLVGHFQRFCKSYPDLVGEGYSGGGEVLSDFHFDFMTSVLHDLEAWAGETGDAELAGAVHESAGRYTAFLDEWEPEAP